MVTDFNTIYDKEEKKILQTPSMQIEKMEDIYDELVVNLKDTADKHKDTCVGIASNQLWKDSDSPPPAIFIAKLTAANGWKIFLNPVIKGSGPKISYKEGCMSKKGKKIKKRDKNVTIIYFDIFDKRIKKEKYTGFDSRIIQHEMDHLKGKLI